jgi:hypothetical protein
VRNDEPCDDKCGCVDCKCKNPLNPEEIEKLIKSVTEDLEKNRGESKKEVCMADQILLYKGDHYGNSRTAQG